MTPGAPSYAVVSGHPNGKDLVFWSGQSWGPSGSAEFHGTRGGAREALAMVSKPPEGFGDPEILDVQAYNQVFGDSIGPAGAAQGQSRGEK